MKRRVLITAIFFLVVVVHLVIQPPVSVYANGGPDIRDLLDGEVGPYYLLITASPGRPSVGTVHLTFFLTDRQRSQAVIEAAIDVVASHPKGSEVEPASYSVNLSTINPNFYDTNVSLDPAGEWTLDILIDGPLGRAETALALQVVDKLNPISAILIVVLIIVLGFTALVLILETSRRRDRRRQKKPSSV